MPDASVPTTPRPWLEHGVVPALAGSAFATSLALYREAHYGRGELTFLIWNLFLAWIPWLLSAVLTRLRSTPASAPLWLAWLVFLPNAPYLITDLIHLRIRSQIPIAYDVAMLFAFAWTGCWLGLTSIRAVHAELARALGPRAGWTFVLAVSALTGFGISLGRFERWNSWHLVTRPRGLFEDIAERLLEPGAHPQTWLATGLFAVFLLAAYGAVLPAPEPSR